MKPNTTIREVASIGAERETERESAGGTSRKSTEAAKRGGAAPGAAGDFKGESPHAPLWYLARNLHFSIRTVKLAFARKRCSAYVAGRLSTYFACRRDCFFPGGEKTIYEVLGDRAATSYKTVQKALQGKGVSSKSAHRIAKVTKLPVLCFVITAGVIGRPPKSPSQR